MFAVYCGLALHHAKLYDKIRRSEQVGTYFVSLWPEPYLRTPQSSLDVKTAFDWEANFIQPFIHFLILIFSLICYYLDSLFWILFFVNSLFIEIIYHSRSIAWPLRSSRITPSAIEMRWQSCASSSSPTRFSSWKRRLFSLSLSLFSGPTFAHCLPKWR